MEEIDIERCEKAHQTYAHTIIPLLAFIVSVIMGYSVFRSAIICIILTPIRPLCARKPRMSFKSVLDGVAKA